MQPSKHNILTKIHGDERWLLANLLSGEADVLEPAIGERLSRGELSALADGAQATELAAKGYLVDPDEEQRRYRKAYLDFLETRTTDEVQLFYAPTYACNFGCSYCFQDEYAPPPPAETAETGGHAEAALTAFFASVDETYGKEALAPSPAPAE